MPSQRCQYEVGMQTDGPEVATLIPAGIIVSEIHSQDNHKHCCTVSGAEESLAKCRKENTD